MSGNVYIALGSNLGDRPENLRHALEAIERIPETHILRVSNIVESEPWGIEDQPAFANAVAVVSTGLRADRLLEWLKDIEATLGREAGPRNGPRVIDLDILLFGDDEWDAPALVVPHPRMAERDFVITPLLEVDPDVRWPDGRHVTRDDVSVGRVTGSLGPVPGFEDASPPVGAMPVDAGEPGDWVVVASAMQGAYMSQSSAQDVLIKSGVLQAHGIPAIVDPMPFGSGPGIAYPGVIETVRLYVPRSREDEAREILSYGERHAAVPHVDPEAYAPQPEIPGDAPRRSAQPYLPPRERSSYPSTWRTIAMVSLTSMIIGLLSGACDSLRLLFDR